MQDYTDLLSEEGPFAKLLDDFAPRPQQQTMAQAVAETIERFDTLVCEAGTGTGKTFAYLVPALLAGRRVIISTGTKHLQDQLYHRDLPVVRRALGSPVKTALLKGRANYLCLHRLALAEQEGEFSRGELRGLKAVRRFRVQTRSGDLGELEGLAEDSPLRPRITSTTDNCLGSECPEYGNCFVLKARRAAQEADVVVINHHLLLADMVLKEEGFGELLPGADAVIVDEAHQLPDLVGLFFGTAFSGRQALELARDARAELLQQGVRDAALDRLLDRLEKSVRDIRLALGEPGRRRAWRDFTGPGLDAALAETEATLGELLRALAPLAEQARGLENCQRRAEQLMLRLAPFLEAEDEAHVRWGEVFRHGFIFYRTPVQAAERFRERLAAQNCAWVFTSATLAVGGDTAHFSARLGLEEARELVLGSPFAFEDNALLYLPGGLPPVSDAGYTQAVLEAALPLIQASRGRAFLLFTSHRALREAGEWLRAKLDLPVLVQGDAPRPRLLEHFRAAGNAVLAGTASFWEGVDVKGQALSLVVIDKLPFASPGDPLLAARLDAIRRAGGNPFRDYQLPQAVLTLKQGVGRLIRDHADTGVLMLCDPRLTGMSYGRVFIQSLPPMPRTRDAGRAVEFLRTRTYLEATA